MRRRLALLAQSQALILESLRVAIEVSLAARIPMHHPRREFKGLKEWTTMNIAYLPQGHDNVKKRL